MIRSKTRRRWLGAAAFLATAAAAQAGPLSIVAGRMTAPGFREAAFERAAIAGERETNRFRFGQAVASALRGLMFRPASAAALAVGAHPYAPLFALRYGRRGNLVSALRTRTGLERLRRR